MAGNINDCLADTNCIGMVENVDTRKVVVGVENEGVLNTLKINDIVVLGGSNSDEKLIGILTKVTKKKVEFDETEQTEDLLYSNNCCVVNLVGSFYNRNLLGDLYRENPVKSRNYEAVKSSKKWENVGNSYIIPALLLYRYSYI